MTHPWEEMSDVELFEAMFPPPVDEKDLERAHHIVAQGGESGFTDRQIDCAQSLIDHYEDN